MRYAGLTSIGYGRVRKHAPQSRRQRSHNFCHGDKADVLFFDFDPVFYRIYNVYPFQTFNFIQFVKIMPITVSRWGNSLAVRIPSSVAARAKLTEGDSVEMSVSSRGKVMIAGVRKELDFGALYKMITPENKYEDVGTGAARGNEVVVW